MARALLVALLLLPFGCADDSDTGSGNALLEPQGEGNLSLEWSISNGGAPLSCVDAAATEVAIVALSDAEERIETVSCFGGFAETGEIPAGDYEISARLAGPDGETIDSVDLGSLTILGDHTTALGAVSFSL